MENQKDLTVTKRELECLFWLSNGLTAKEIAREMHISSRTVESYMKKIRYKTNLHRRSHIIAFYRKISDVDRNKMIELGGLV